MCPWGVQNPHRDTKAEDCAYGCKSYGYLTRFMCVGRTHYLTAEQRSFEFPYVFINFCFDLTVSVELIILTVFLGLGDISGRVFTSSRFVNTIYAFIIYLHFSYQTGNAGNECKFPTTFCTVGYLYTVRANLFYRSPSSSDLKSPVPTKIKIGCFF